MANLPSHPDSDDARTGPNVHSMTSRPRWQTALWIIIPAVLLVAFIVLHVAGVFGPGEH